MRKPLIIGNWKMNTTLSDAIVLTTAIRNAAHELEEAEIVLCPPFTWLVPMQELLEHAPANLKLGAQNMWFAEKGAMTGEISPLMLEGLASYVILGHSERRMHFDESNALINDKVQAALLHKIRPIIAVGELKKMPQVKKGRGRPSEISVKMDILEELRAALRGVSAENVSKVIIAYEPVWAIGTGTPATGEYANEMAFKLRKVLSDKYGDEIAQEIRILYGGSVDSENIKDFVYQPEIDGALVGGASLKANEFIKICEKIAGREEE